MGHFWLINASTHLNTPFSFFSSPRPHCCGCGSLGTKWLWSILWALETNTSHTFSGTCGLVGLVLYCTPILSQCTETCTMQARGHELQEKQNLNFLFMMKNIYEVSVCSTLNTIHERPGARCDNQWRPEKKVVRFLWTGSEVGNLLLLTTIISTIMNGHAGKIMRTLPALKTIFRCCLNDDSQPQ